jgi:hypothetical protein
MVGVDRSRVLVGDVRAKKLIRPRQGDCGAPGKYQVQWLREKLLASLHLRVPSGSSMPSADTLILIVRTKSRQLKNSNALLVKAQEVAYHQALRLYVHNDEKVCTHLPMSYTSHLPFAHDNIAPTVVYMYVVTAIG